MSTKELGEKGELQAQNYVRAIDYEIMETNYRSKYGEIDLIAIDYPTLVFIEVKTRTTNSFGIPAESISYRKKQKIIKTALKFLNTSTRNLPKRWRIDIIGIQLDQHNRFKAINHIKNI